MTVRLIVAALLVGRAGSMRPTGLGGRQRQRTHQKPCGWTWRPLPGRRESKSRLRATCPDKGRQSTRMDTQVARRRLSWAQAQVRQAEAPSLRSLGTGGWRRAETPLDRTWLLAGGRKLITGESATDTRGAGQAQSPTHRNNGDDQATLRRGRRITGR